ncbi:MAG TPA: amidohydrolase [Kofleriaceae bacterium]
MIFRSISRSGLLISCLAGCGSSQGPSTTTPPPPLVSSDERPGANDGVDYLVTASQIVTNDPEHPTATAIAIDGDTIVGVGAPEDLAKLVGHGTQRVVLDGAISPGLVDAHAHLYGLGLALDGVLLKETISEADAISAVKADVTRFGPTEWITGRGWDQTRWPKAAWPTKETLDAAFPNRATYLRRVDGHAAWCSSAALAAAHITRDTKDPAGGKIMRDAKGNPTGVLVDNALDLVENVMPAATPEMRERRIRAAAQLAIAAGITGVDEMGIEPETADVYARLAAANHLPLHVYAFLDGSKPAVIAGLSTPPVASTNRLTVRGVKFFADGALGSRGARLFKPYDDEPKSSGLWVTTPEQLAANIDLAVAHGWQVAVHAIGDAAVGSVLDGFIAAETKAGSTDQRLRVEHAQVVRPEDFEKFVRAHAIASMQPTHATSDMRWAEQRIGKQRIRGAYAWRTMLDRSIPLAFGSDFPIEEVSPILGLYAATTRQDADGSPAAGWYPEQRLTFAEALAAFTSGAAYAQFEETTRGRIAPGFKADLTIYALPLAGDKSLLKNKVVATIVDGEVVYDPEQHFAAPAKKPKTFDFIGLPLQGRPAEAQH